LRYLLSSIIGTYPHNFRFDPTRQQWISQLNTR
jgi:hypothetical protein